MSGKLRAGVIAIVVALLLAGVGLTTGTGPLASAAAAVVQPIDPARLLDTRPGESTVDGRFAGLNRRAAGSVTEVQVAGRAGIPNDATGAMLNLTAVLPDTGTFLTIFPCGITPNASHLNVPAGDIRANSVFAQLSTTGTVCIYTVARTDIVLDANGYVPAGAAPTSLNPARLLDTRPGVPTIDGQFAGIGRAKAGSETEIQVAGRAGIPDDATAVVLNLTAVLPDAGTYLTVYPCGTKPNASNLNAPAGDIRANNAFVKLSIKGTACIYTVAPSDIVVDVSGYVPAGRTPTSLDPARLLDTRPGERTIDGQSSGAGQARAGSVTEVQIAGRAGVPSDATAALLNLTAVLPDAGTYLTAFPCGTKPNASNVNAPVGDIRANGAFVKLSANGTVCVYTVAATDIIIDVNGFATTSDIPPPPTTTTTTTTTTSTTTPTTPSTTVAPSTTTTTTAPPTACRVRGVVVATALDGPECDALVALYDNTGGSNWANHTGWISNTDPCTWYGVGCERGHVATLNLVANGLAGALPSELGNLVHLRELVVDYNKLTGVPATISGLKAVRTISLKANRLTSLPSQFGELANLELLYLGQNQWSSLPDELGNLQKLSYLAIDNSELTSIPTGVYQLTNLAVLDLSRNAITTIPDEIASLTNLRTLSMHHNAITSIATPIGQLANLVDLFLYDNSLAAIPGAINSLSNLEQLRLDNNELTSIPRGIGGQQGPTKLRVLTVGGNRLTSIPYQVGNLSNLEELGLSFNLLSSLPTELGNLTNLRSLYLYGNSFAIVPSWIQGLTKLNKLSFGNNQLRGDITAVFLPLKQANQLSTLVLGGNRCLWSTDASLSSWLAGLDPNWNNGC